MTGKDEDVQISLLVPTKLLDRLDKLAEKDGRSRQKECIYIFGQWLDWMETHQPAVKRRSNG